MWCPQKQVKSHLRDGRRRPRRRTSVADHRGLPHAGYYMWRLRAPSKRAIRHAWLLDQIIEVHAASQGTYGARCVHPELTLGRGVKVATTPSRC